MVSASKSFRQPTPQDWAELVRKIRTLCPLPFPVEVTRSLTPPAWADPDWAAGCIVEQRGPRDIRPLKACVWVHKKHHRGAAVDSLLHEWTHLLRVEELGVVDATMLHDDAFWTKFGEVYRAWRREC